MSTPPSSFDLSTLGSDISTALTNSGFWGSFSAVIVAGLGVMIAFWGIPKVIRLFKRVST